MVGTTADGDAARSIIRFDYAHGAAVAAALRAEVIRQATARRKPTPGHRAGGGSRSRSRCAWTIRTRSPSDRVPVASRGDR
ncbi:hypothetical protein GCM10025881_38440 [Pseudolysinimonas kribbensis]|uniref:Uncharacterized protein n=1 Tax=Pseudolysinimonas kribbensis TaxID=433641 RepID=A0ABQ6K8J3_9MICO|nr:hypothetical protein GCM10025881_38440 [Pseudolysinimonas kribbensis]